MLIRLQLWQRHMSADAGYDRHVARVLKHLCIFCDLRDYKNADCNYPFRLPAEVSTAIVKAVTHYSHLAIESVKGKLMRWAVVPKFHHLWH